jgi:hypothetical protein
MPDEPLTYEQSATALREVGQILVSVEKAYKLAVENAAIAEALYRKSLGDKFESYRKEGKGVEESNLLARRDVYNLSLERDKASGMMRYELERLEDRRGNRASLHRLVEWSGALAVMNGTKRHGDAANVGQ